MPSIVALSNDVQFDYEQSFAYPTAISSPSTSSATTIRPNLNSRRGSLSNFSTLLQNQPEFPNYDTYPSEYPSVSKQTPVFYETSIESPSRVSTNNPITHAKFVPDDQLLESLVAYADSFSLENDIYSVQNSMNFTTPSIPSVQSIPSRRRTKSTTAHLTSILDNEIMSRHKSCDDLSLAASLSSSSKTTTVIPKDDQCVTNETEKFIPSQSHPQFSFGIRTNSEDEQINKFMEDATITAGVSKAEWPYSSDTFQELNKSCTDLFHAYESRTNIEDIKSNYIQDLDRISTMAATIDFAHEVPAASPASRPVILRKKVKDFVVRQKVDIQLLRPPTPPTPAPIIIREIRSKPKGRLQSITIRQKLEDSNQIHVSKTPSPIIIRERPPPCPTNKFNNKPTIVYREIPRSSASSPLGGTIVTERLRPNTSAIIQKPAPIVIEKWLPYPPEPKRPVIYERVSPVLDEEQTHNGEKPKQIIVEYDDVNVIVNKDVQQRKEVKRVQPEEYVKQYGNSLYSNETMNKLFKNVTCSSQVN